jgi:copper(I)-binding protein
VKDQWNVNKFCSILPTMFKNGRFQVLTAASMTMIAWDVAPCRLVEADRNSRRAYCLHHHGDDGGMRRMYAPMKCRSA